MRAFQIVAFGSGVLAAVAAVACAASGDNEGTTPEHEAGVIPDSAAPTNDAALPVDAGTDGPTCSGAGWCRTSLPDVDLVLLDIWTASAHAFAIAESLTLGIKVLEWSDADAKWQYIDDATQNRPGSGTYGGSIWARGDDEVYFGVGPGWIYRGTRPVAPATAWTWTRQELEDNDQPGDIDGWPHGHRVDRRFLALGVWGTATDVYAWFKNTIYRRTSGTPEWVPEYVADDFEDPDEHLFFTGAATNADEVWFSGARARSSSACALLLRKTATGDYQRIADGTVSDVCTPRAELLAIGDAAGRLTDLQAIGAGQLVVLKDSRDVARITTLGDGGFALELAPPPGASVGLDGTERFTSLWSGADAFWITTRGLVIRGTNLWPSGAYEISSIAQRGSPLAKDVYRVRGTSQTNLWAIGETIALHKTTP